VIGATLEEMRWFNELERISASAETAIRLLHVLGDIDVTDLLPRVAVPIRASNPPKRLRLRRLIEEFQRGRWIKAVFDGFMDELLTAPRYNTGSRRGGPLL
jgi:hypothetical protein